MMSGRANARKIWFHLHLYLGLFLGGIVAITSLTGSLLVFAWPVDEWLNAEKMLVEVPAGATNQPLSRIIEAGRSAVPAGSTQVDWISFPGEPGDVFTTTFEIPPSPDTYQVFINPYTAEVIGQRLWGTFDACCSWHGPLIPVLYRFHDSFWLGETGLIVTGIVALVMLASLISGIVLWWPRRSRLTGALTIKRNTSNARRLFDLHRVTGIYAVTVLAILFFTGAYLSLQHPFEKQVKGLVSLFSPLTTSPDWGGGWLQGQPSVSLEQAIAVANYRFPQARIDSVDLPEAGQPFYEVWMAAHDDLVEQVPRRMIMIDAKDGHILFSREPQKNSAGDTFSEWQLALHCGQGFGFLGQLLVMLAGLAPAVLYVTGVVRWVQKRRVRRGMPRHA